MKVVSNASPLINLARIGELDLLYRLYEEIAIPEAVRYEVVIEGVGRPGAQKVEKADWIHSRATTHAVLVRALRENLDAGEAETIALGLEIEADLLLMDEHQGRESARHLGLRVTGLIGVLIEAKHRGLIDSVRTLLEKLREVAGFWIDEELFQRVLQDENEA